jgi:hypothetical protein
MNLLKTLNNLLPSLDDKKKEPVKEDLPPSSHVPSEPPPRCAASEEATNNSNCNSSNDETSASEEIESQRYSIFKSLSSKLGMDITVGVTLPVWLCEPVTVIQRMCEMLNFCDLLEEASKLENPLDRLAYVAVFAITAYNGTERYSKPFNPILGETYEYVDEAKGIRYIAEQVSHHPPVAAAHADCEKFVFWQDSTPKSKFYGNYLEIETQSKTHIYFPHTRDHFVYTSIPLSRVNNLIIGRIWIDHFGTLSITNATTGDSCTINFEKCGWLSKGRYEVSGTVKDSKGTECLQINGKWSSSVNVKWNYEQGKHPKDTTVCLWKRPEPNAFGKYKLTEFAAKLNKLDPKYESVLPVTDSRLRPDRRALDSGDMANAGIAKSRLEDKQRSDKRDRDGREEEWSPRWFKMCPEEHGQGNMWTLVGDYWGQKKTKLSLLEKQAKFKEQQGEDLTPEEKKQLKELLNGDVFGFACDFSSSYSA